MKNPIKFLAWVKSNFNVRDDLWTPMIWKGVQPYFSDRDLYRKYVKGGNKIKRVLVVVDSEKKRITFHNDLTYKNR